MRDLRDTCVKDCVLRTRVNGQIYLLSTELKYIKLEMLIHSRNQKLFFESVYFPIISLPVMEGYQKKRISVNFAIKK